VRMQTGTDEHGDKIAEAAAAAGQEPKAYVDRISQRFRETWPPLNIQPDHFIRTTDPEHVAVVQAILQRVYEAGDIYFAKYAGNYCVGCERFLTDRELVEGKCPDHGTTPQYQEEENYFFRMSKYQDALVRHIEEHPDFIRPERYRNEVLSMLAEPLEDLCISRPKSRLTWGITLPFDQNFVTYVWFDALINYVSGLGWRPEGADPLYQEFWAGPEAEPQHLIAKDILKPHAIYWPTMLMAAGLPLYRHLNVHGYWNIAGGKMSKSRGNVVTPLELKDVYGVDAFRYFLMREMTFGLDSAFSEELLVERYNSDLANDLGNLFSRVLNMLQRYRQGVVPAAGAEEEDTRTWRQRVIEAGRTYREQMEGFAFHRALAEVWALVGEANKYVVQSEPWVLAKDPAQAARLDVVLHNLVQVLGAVSLLVWPVMPATAEKMAGVLGMPAPGPGGLAEVSRLWGLVPPGTRTAKPEALFPRVQTERVKAKAAKKEAKAAGKTPPPEKKAKKTKKPTAPQPLAQIDIELFSQVQLKVGRVVEAERIASADRLLKLLIDLGEPEPRQVVAGIAQHYQPEELVGRQVVVVANLKPVKLRGVESRGMVLACVEEGRVRLVAPDQEMTPGSVVR